MSSPPRPSRAAATPHTVHDAYALLANAHRGEVACYELTLDHDVLHPVKTSGWYAGCNIPLDPRVRNLDQPPPSGFDNVLMSGSRRVRWEELIEGAKGRIDAATAQTVLADHRDAYLRQDVPSSRTICDHFDNDDGRLPGGGLGPRYPWGSLDGKAADSACALSNSLWARWGRACGTPFDVEEYLAAQPQYAWFRGWMLDRTRFADGAA